MPPRKQDEQFASHLPGVIRYHARMFSDRVRNDLLYRAVKQAVSSETTFLDVGAGSGIWAILAAKLGAKRVVSVEIEEALIPMIHRHAQENGVANRIEIIHGNIDDVPSSGKFDVIVCELFGRDAFGAATVRSIVRLRKRFLASGGVLIPKKLEMCAVPLLSVRSAAQTLVKRGLTANFLSELKSNYPEELSPAEVGQLRYAAAPKTLFEIDLQTVDAIPGAVEYSATWKLAHLSRVSGIGVFQRSTFADCIELDSRESKSWNFTRYNFEPFDERSGTIRFDLLPEVGNASWSVSLTSHPKIRPRTYSPVFAYTRTRMAQASTPHKRFRGPRKIDKDHRPLG